MYERILLATDGSECARTATRHAINLAKTSDATLHALYVIETRTEYDSGIVDPETVERHRRGDGEEILADVEADAQSVGGDVVCSIRRGIPDREIADYVDEHGIDLVVLGARGTSTFKTVLLGSTSEAVVRDATVPVVLLPNGAATESS